MASIVTTVRHHHPRDGGRVSPAVSADCVLAIQRVFRGYRVRKQRLREEHLIDPSSLLGTLDRHNRERKGFCSLLSYTLYLLLFVLLVLSRSNSLSRFHMESAFVSAIGGVSTASGKDLYGVTSEDDVCVPPPRLTLSSCVCAHGRGHMPDRVLVCRVVGLGWGGACAAAMSSWRRCCCSSTL